MSHFSQKLPPMNSLVAFEAAARLGSFSRAGNEIGRTQASVSRQIKLLEDNIGLRLFDRQRHNVILTDQGVKLEITVRLALGELAKATEQIRDDARGRKSLTVFTDITIATFLVSPILGEFQRMFPTLKIKILSSYEGIAQTTETFDIGLQQGNSPQERFHTYPIANDVIFPVCSPEFAAKHGSALSKADLVSIPLLHLDDQGRGWPDWDDFYKHIDVKPSGKLKGLIFSTYDVCLEVAAQGEGVALGWSRSVRQKIDEGKLVRFGHFNLPLPNSIFAYTPRLNQSSKHSEVFLKLLRSNLKAIQHN